MIVSDGLRKHIYSTINDKKNFHAELSEKISENLPNFDRRERARQFELAGDFNKAYSVWIEDINISKELAAYSYVRNILNH